MPQSKKTTKFEGLRCQGNDLHIFGLIGQGGVTAEEVANLLPPPGEPVRVFISSFGGSYVEALAIHNLLKLRQGKTITIAVGSVGSAATIIYAAGDDRLASPQAIFMYHKSKLDPGNVSLEDLKSISKFMGDAEEGIKKIYLGSSNLSQEQVEELLSNGDTFLNPEQAKEKGLVTRILGEKEKLSLDASTYRNLAANFGIHLIDTNKEKKMDEELKQYIINLKLDPKEVEKDKTKLELLKLAFEATKEKGKSPPPLPKKDKDKDISLLFDEEGIKKKTAKAIAEEQERLENLQMIFKNPEFADVEKVEYDGKVITLQTFKKKVRGDSNFSPEKLELIMYRAARPSGPAVHTIDRSLENTSEKALTISLLKNVGVPYNNPIPTCNEKVKVPSQYSRKPNYGLEQWYSEKDLELSDTPQYRNVTLHTLYSLILQQAGMSIRRGTGSAEGFVQRATEAYWKLKMAGEFSTMAASNILEDAANKMLLASYQAQAVTWPILASIKNFNDFKTHNFYRLDINGKYETIGNTGELKHGWMDDAKFTATIDTYGMIMGISRKDKINDDLDAFSTIMKGMGKKANLANESLFYEAFMGNIVNWTSPSAESALAIAAMETIRKVFTQQTDDGDPIMVTPRILLTGGTLAFTAQQILGQPQFLPSGQDAALDISQVGIKNPWYNRYTPVDSEYVDNTSVLNTTNGAAISGQTTTGWGLMADPNDLPAVFMGFLNGNQNPITQQQEMPFETLGDRFRMYHDVGTGLGDTKAVVWSNGDA